MRNNLRKSNVIIQNEKCLTLSLKRSLESLQDFPKVDRAKSIVQITVKSRQQENPLYTNFYNFLDRFAVYTASNIHQK